MERFHPHSSCSRLTGPRQRHRELFVTSSGDVFVNTHVESRRMEHFQKKNPRYTVTGRGGHNMTRNFCLRSWSDHFLHWGVSEGFDRIFHGGPTTTRLPTYHSLSLLQHRSWICTIQQNSIFTSKRILGLRITPGFFTRKSVA